MIRLACLALGAAGALALAACASATHERTQHWVKADATLEEFQTAKAACEAYRREEFNPYEAFDDPLLPTAGVEENLNKRLAYRRMFERCMTGHGFRLEGGYP